MSPMTAEPIVRPGDEPKAWKNRQNNSCDMDGETATPIDEMNKIGIPTRYIGLLPSMVHRLKSESDRENESPYST